MLLQSIGCSSFIVSGQHQYSKHEWNNVTNKNMHTHPFTYLSLSVVSLQTLNTQLSKHEHWITIHFESHKIDEKLGKNTHLCVLIMLDIKLSATFDFIDISILLAMF